MTWRDKVAAVRAELRELSADAMIVTSLDEVAWLLNVRGRDVPYAPLLKAFVIVGMRDVRVYAPPGKLSMPVREALAVYNCYASSNNCTRYAVSQLGAFKYSNRPYILIDLFRVPINTASTNSK